MEIYQSLYENTKNITMMLDESQITYVTMIIPKLDQKGHELVFFLIRMFNNQQSKDVTFQLPYNARQEDNKVTFDLNKFPIQLQHMIHMFVRMHYEYTEDAKKRPLILQ